MTPENGTRRTTPVCMAGMHRSGTSLVARVLNLCGLFLGPVSDVMGEGSSNADGFWEHIPLLNMNDRILAAAGGGWDIPPPAERIVKLARDESLRADAEALLLPFQGHPLWGWKDPRNCLTIGFWQSLIPDLRFVVSVRDPREVVDSLYRRDFSSPAFSYNLWRLYHQSILAGSDPSSRIVLHYEAALERTRAEAGRLLRFLDIMVPEASLDRAVAAASSSLRHNRRTADLRADGVPEDIVEMYAQLCHEAEWQPEGTHPRTVDLKPSPPPTARRSRMPGIVRRLLASPVLAELRRRDRAIAELRRQLDDRIRSSGRDE
jgi:hypothetical protein